MFRLSAVFFLGLCCAICPCSGIRWCILLLFVWAAPHSDSWPHHTVNLCCVYVVASFFVDSSASCSFGKICPAAPFCMTGWTWNPYSSHGEELQSVRSSYDTVCSGSDTSSLHVEIARWDPLFRWISALWSRLSVLSIAPIGCSRMRRVSHDFSRRLEMDREWEPVGFISLLHQQNKGFTHWISRRCTVVSIN